MNVINLIFFLFFIFNIFGVEKRGFIAENEEGRLFLMERPQVKSCCVGSAVKGIELIGDYRGYSRYGAVTLQGTLVETLDGLKLVQDGFTVPDLFPKEVFSD